jgi:hypothetical protein
MNDLIQFNIIKILNPETKEDFDNSCDIFGDGIYFVENCQAVGTRKPNEPYTHSTDWILCEIGAEDFVKDYLSKCNDFKKELDKLTEKAFKEDIIDFDILIEFSYDGEFDSYGEFDYNCYYLGIIQ